MIIFGDQGLERYTHGLDFNTEDIRTKTGGNVSFSVYGRSIVCIHTCIYAIRMYNHICMFSFSRICMCRVVFAQLDLHDRICTYVSVHAYICLSSWSHIITYVQICLCTCTHMVTFVV